MTWETWRGMQGSTRQGRERRDIGNLKDKQSEQRQTEQGQGSETGDSISPIPQHMQHIWLTSDCPPHLCTLLGRELTRQLARLVKKRAPPPP